MPTKTWIGRDGVLDTDANWNPSPKPIAADDVIFQKGMGRGPVNRNLTAITALVNSVAVIDYEWPIGGEGNPLAMNVDKDWVHDSMNPVWWQGGSTGTKPTVTVAKRCNFHLIWGDGAFKPDLNILAGVFIGSNSSAGNAYFAGFRVAPKDNQIVKVRMHDVKFDQSQDGGEFVIDGGVVDLFYDFGSTATSQCPILVSGGTLNQHGSFFNTRVLQTGGIINYMPKRGSSAWDGGTGANGEAHIFGGMFDASMAEPLDSAPTTASQLNIFPGGEYKVRLDTDLKIVDYRRDLGGGGGGGIG